MTGLATYDNLFFKSKSVRKRTIKITDVKNLKRLKKVSSFKKIIKSVQGSVPKGTKEIRVQYTNRKVTKLTVGRKYLWVVVRK